MLNLYLPDKQIITFSKRSWPAEKTAGGEHMGCEVPIQSSPEAVFLCDRNCRLFVTVVQFEGILWGLRDHRQGFPLIIVTVVGDAGKRHRRRNIRNPATTCQALRADRPMRAVLALDCCRVPRTWSGFMSKCTQMVEGLRSILPHFNHKSWFTMAKIN